MKSLGKHFLLKMRSFLLRIENKFDGNYLAPDVPMSGKISHSRWEEYLGEIGNKKGMRILEVGSRQLPGRPSLRNRFDSAEFTGFDFYAGKNVDVVGDAHQLSKYFEAESFDLVISNSCFEHFAMPWQVSHEIVKVLKTGGIVFVETHFSFSSHERPWHFFQFSDKAMEVLFPRAMGIEVIESGVSNPIVGRFSVYADPYLRNNPVTGLYCHTEFMGRKVENVPEFNWGEAQLDQIVGDDRYPEPPD